MRSPVKPRDLNNLVLRAEQSLMEAMRVIDREGVEIAFVGDERGRIIGTLSDGDVRRALIRGTTVEARHAVGAAMKRDFIRVSPATRRAEVLDIMRLRRIGQVPAIDDSGALVALHLLSEVLGGTERQNAALIMAGGRGSRLLPLTESIPKPMLRVAGRPILERIILHLVGYGVRDVVISINYLGDVIEKYFGDGSAFGCRIRYLREEIPLGTGGALSLLPELPTLPMLVLNGDLITQVNIDQLLRFHEERRFRATICARPYQFEVPFGVIDSDGEVLTGLREKPAHNMLINAGIYVLSPETLRLVPKGKEYSITSMFETLLSKGVRVGVFDLEDEWIDVGRHEELKKARGQ